MRIILADDHMILRDGLRAMLQQEADLEICGEASNGQELLEQLAANPVDMVIMDINMPVMDGFEATRQVREQFPDVHILILSMLDHESYVSRIIESGATGYVLKDTSRFELLHAIRTVADGNFYVCMKIAQNLLLKVQRSRPTEPRQKAGFPATGLGGDISRRELEVLKLITEGHTTKEVADLLFTSQRTIESHRQSLMEKTQTRNVAALVRYALLNGLIE